MCFVTFISFSKYSFSTLSTVFISFSLFSFTYSSTPTYNKIKFSALFQVMIKFYFIFMVMVLFLVKDNNPVPCTDICSSEGVWERASLLPLVLDFSVLPHNNYGFANVISFPAGLWGYTAAHRPQG